MARALRIDIKDGWYDITNRGLDRQRIFGDSRDYGHFLELLGEMHERYLVRVPAGWNIRLLEKPLNDLVA